MRIIGDSGVSRSLVMARGVQSFFKPFILHKDNIVVFLANGFFDSKFVYNNNTGQLALAGNDDLSHKRIASFAIGNTSPGQGIGAYFTVSRDRNRITLHLKSGYYGNPSLGELFQVANAIKKMLEQNGVSVDVSSESDRVFISIV